MDCDVSHPLCFLNSMVLFVRSFVSQQLYASAKIEKAFLESGEQAANVTDAERHKQQPGEKGR